ncbi:hypothetical protein KXD40_009006 [Peronospora effusa]|nr:hypothetical protein KXD40_009006 [Peronospora effusa]
MSTPAPSPDSPSPPEKARKTAFSVRNSMWLVVALLAIAVATFVRNPKLLVRHHLLETPLPDAVNCTDAHQFLTDVMPIKGFHVLCIETTTTDTLKVTSFKDGMHANESLETTKDIETFSYAVEEELLQISKPSDEYGQKYKQPSAYFTPEGVRLEKNVTALENQIVFLFEGGQFIWPGVRIGHKSEYMSRL